MKKNTLAFTLIVMLMAAQANADSYIDWRKTGSASEKQTNMIKALPGTSTHMLQVGERYRNLYWAAKQNKWEFANYQLEEIEELIKTVGITRPKRKTTADQFLTTAFALLPAAIKNKDQPQFEIAFKHMRAQCLICHIKNNHGFITLPSTPSMGSSLVLESNK